MQTNLEQVCSTIESHWNVLLLLSMVTFPWFPIFFLIFGRIGLCLQWYWVYFDSQPENLLSFQNSWIQTIHQNRQIGRETKQEMRNRTKHGKNIFCIQIKNIEMVQVTTFNIIACNFHLIAIWNICMDGEVSILICRIFSLKKKSLLLSNCIDNILHCVGLYINSPASFHSI